MSGKGAMSFGLISSGSVSDTQIVNTPMGYIELLRIAIRKWDTIGFADTLALMLEVARKQTSFRFDESLHALLIDVAERTHRTPRQVVELSLSNFLPFVESGAMDSPEWRKMEELIASERQRAAALAERIGALAGVPAKTRDAAKTRRLAVFRIEESLLKRTRAASVATGRNVRQVVELCLQCGVPLVAVLYYIGPELHALKADFQSARGDASKVQGSMHRFIEAVKDAFGRMLQTPDAMNPKPLTAEAQPAPAAPAPKAGAKPKPTKRKP